MADTRISALPAVTTPDSADEFAVNDAGTSKKITLAQISTYLGRTVRNASVANQTGFAVDTYLAGSEVAIPAGALRAKAMYMCRFNVSKTAAGLGTPLVIVRIGTGAATTDPSRASLSFPAQTAIVDDGIFEVRVTFRTVGAATAATLQALGQLTHRQSITGLSTLVSPSVTQASAGFDSTTAGLIIGLSVNGGTSVAWTVNVVQAELLNLA